MQRGQTVSSNESVIVIMRHILLRSLVSLILLLTTHVLLLERLLLSVKNNDPCYRVDPILDNPQPPDICQYCLIHSRTPLKLQAMLDSIFTTFEEQTEFDIIQMNSFGINLILPFSCTQISWISFIFRSDQNKMYWIKWWHPVHPYPSQYHCPPRHFEWLYLYHSQYN